MAGWGSILQMDGNRGWRGEVIPRGLGREGELSPPGFGCCRHKSEGGEGPQGSYFVWKGEDWERVSCLQDGICG